MTLKKGSKDSLLKDANKQRKRWPIKNIRTRKAPAGLYRVLSKWMDSKSRIPQSILFIPGLRTPNQGINQRYMKTWADVADKICFGRTKRFGIGIEFLAL